MICRVFPFSHSSGLEKPYAHSRIRRCCVSLFDQLVIEALRSRADLTTLRPVVEKELLHHDILREMSEAGLLTGLTFIGGTCLRACYGSQRLSEDLDFTGGADFKKQDLAI